MDIPHTNTEEEVTENPYVGNYFVSMTDGAEFTVRADSQVYHDDYWLLSLGKIPVFVCHPQDVKYIIRISNNG